MMINQEQRAAWSRELSEFGLKTDLDQLQRTAHEMLAPLAEFRRREVYEYMNRLERLVFLLRNEVEYQANLIIEHQRQIATGKQL
jgi:hypothetical protein